MLHTAAMGALESDQGTRCVLCADHLIGREPGAGLRVGDGSVSWRHAALRWAGRVWELHDLGSRNGTFVDGKRVEVGARLVLRLGAELRFGEAPEIWRLVDTEPPLASAVDLASGERIFAEAGLIALPSAEDPAITLYHLSDGNWVAESCDLVWGTQPLEVLAVGGRHYRFEPGVMIHSTSAGPLQAPSIGNVALDFQVSRDEEHVEVTIVHRQRRVPLRPRAHSYLLLTLARLRAQDQAQPKLPPTSHGWVAQERLLKMLATTPTQLAVDIYRARQQFGESGVTDAAQIVERRPTTHELRLGVASVSIEVV